MLSAFSACNEKTDLGRSEKINFVLDRTPNTNHTGLYVAIEKGYFKDSGLDVQIVQPSKDGAELMVSSGQAQFGISSQDKIAPGLIGKNELDLTAVGTILQHNDSGIISRKAEGMHTPKGLEGKTYSSWGSPIEKTIIKEVLEKDEGDFSKLIFQPNKVTDEVSALKSGSVDAIWGHYSWTGIAAEIANLDTDYFAFADVSPVLDYYAPILVANNKYLKDNPEMAKAFLKALKKGYEFAIEKPEEAGKILLKAAPKLSEELVIASQKYISPLYKDDVKSWGYIDGERWDNFFSWLYENELISTKPESGKGFSNEFLPE